MMIPKKKNGMRIYKNSPNASKWQAMLKEIYDHAPYLYQQNQKEYFLSDEHSLAKKIKITGYELVLCMNFLQQNELIEVKRIKPTVIDKNDDVNLPESIILTSKGFDVILDLQKHKDSNILQFGMFLFTGFTAFITTIAIILPYLDENLKKDIFFICAEFFLLFLAYGSYSINKLNKY